MCLEIKDSIVGKCPGDFWGALKTSQNEKPYMLKELGIPEINVRLYKNFQNLIALHVWCVGFAEMTEWCKNGTTLGQNGLNSSRDKNMQKLVKYKVQIISHVKNVLTHSVKVDFNHISMVCSY